MLFILYLDNKICSVKFCVMNYEKRLLIKFIFDFVLILNIYNFLKYILKLKEL